MKSIATAPSVIIATILTLLVVLGASMITMASTAEGATEGTPVAYTITQPDLVLSLTGQGGITN